MNVYVYAGAHPQLRAVSPMAHLPDEAASTSSPEKENVSVVLPG